MPDTAQAIQETLIDPLDDILFNIGRGIAAAQMELDRNSLATQVMIDNDETLGEYGIQATWYHFPETTIELRLSFSMRWEEIKQQGRPSIWKQVLYAAPYNAAYKNLYAYDAAGTSLIRARIVSVPSSKSIVTE